MRRRCSLEKGREQGLREGEALLLQRLVQRRFDELPDWVKERLTDASPKQLEQWAERLLDIDSLDSLFRED